MQTLLIFSVCSRNSKYFASLKILVTLRTENRSSAQALQLLLDRPLVLRHISLKVKIMFTMPICQNKIALTSIHISKYDIKYSNQSLFSLFFKILRNIFSYLLIGFNLLIIQCLQVIIFWLGT